MVADGGDDEVGALDGGSSVAVRVDGAGGDDLSAFNALMSVTGGAVVILAVDDPHGFSGGADVDFDIPIAAAFTEVEAVPVDGAAPLFGCPATVAVDGDTLLLREPGVQLTLNGVLGGADFEPIRGVASTRRCR